MSTIYRWHGNHAIIKCKPAPTWEPPRDSSTWLKRIEAAIRAAQTLNHPRKP